jgi:hypothetical protein
MDNVDITEVNKELDKTAYLLNKISDYYESLDEDKKIFTRDAFIKMRQ